MEQAKESETDSAILFSDEIHNIIEHQIKVYTHLRNQAQRLIRILVAAGAIIVAAISSDVVNSNLITDLPRYHSRIANTLSVNVDFIEITSQANILIGVVFSSIGIILILDSFFWAAKILQMRGLQPLMGEGSRTTVSVITYSPEADLPNSDLSALEQEDRDAKKWLENNDDLLYRAKEHLRLTYERLGVGISFLLFGGLVIVTAQLGLGRILALMNAATVVAVVGAISWEVWKALKWFRIWNVDSETGPLSDALWEAAERKISDWPHSFLFPFLFILMSYGFLFSLLITLSWLFEVVLPTISRLT